MEGGRPEGLVAGRLWPDDRRALLRVLKRAWDATTSASPGEWSPENPALGQCAVTALVVQDRFGGDLLRTTVGGVSHYFNRLPSGQCVDLTFQQFAHGSEYGEVVERDRDYVLGFEATRRRYNVLRKRVSHDLDTVLTRPHKRRLTIPSVLHASAQHHPRVYIAGPFKDGVVSENVHNAVMAAHQLLDRGFSPYCPHGTTHMLALVEPRPQSDWYALDMEWLRVCDAVLRLPGKSSGADQEVGEANRLGIPVFYSIGALNAELGSRSKAVSGNHLGA
jgi:nucleoside 2-deoxyribosyltransferase